MNRIPYSFPLSAYSTCSTLVSLARQAILPLTRQGTERPPPSAYPSLFGTIRASPYLDRGRSGTPLPSTCTSLLGDDDVYPRETPPHIRTARASPQRHTAAGTATPTTSDTGNTVPQRANPTQTAYAHPRRRTQAQGQRLGTWTLVRPQQYYIYIYIYIYRYSLTEMDARCQMRHKQQ